MEIQSSTEQAIPLIYRSNQTEKFQVNQHALKFISGIPQPISIISMVGLYRTGKSYLLNKMLLNRNKGGFQVSSTVNACTKGLWIWPEVIKGKSKDNQEVNVLVIDTQGIGSLQEDSNHDIKTFVLGILISSCFVYSSVGAIQSSSIDNLSLVIYLTEMLGKKLGSKIEKPDFIWVLRDFNLALRDEEGNSFTSNQYLQKALTEEKGNSEASLNRNKIKNCIKDFFKQRECITFIRPLGSGELQNLMSLPFESLRPEFVQTLLTTRNRLLTKSNIKMFKNQPVDGKVLSMMVQKYTNAMNSDQMPNILTAWESITQHIQDQYVAETLQTIQDEINQLQLPTSKQYLETQLNKIRERSTKKIEHLSFNSQTIFNQQLRKKQSKKLKKNSESSRDFVLNHLNTKYKTLESSFNRLQTKNQSHLIDFQNQLLLLEQEANRELSKYQLGNYSDVLVEWKLKNYEDKWSYLCRSIESRFQEESARNSEMIELYKEETQRLKRQLKGKREEHQREIMGLKNSNLKLECELSIQEQKYNIRNRSIQQFGSNPNQSFHTFQSSPSKSSQHHQQLQKLSTQNKQKGKQIEMLKQQIQFNTIRYTELSTKYQQAKKSQSHYLSIIGDAPKQNKILFDQGVFKEIQNQQNSSLKESLSVLEGKYKIVGKENNERGLKVSLLEQEIGRLNGEIERQVGLWRERESGYQQRVSVLSEEVRVGVGKYEQEVRGNRELRVQIEELEGRVYQLSTNPNSDVQELKQLKRIYEQQKILRKKSLQQQKHNLQEKYNKALQDMEKKYLEQIEQLEQGKNQAEEELVGRNNLQVEYQGLQGKCEFYRESIRGKERAIILLESEKSELETAKEVLEITNKSMKQELASVNQRHDQDYRELKSQEEQKRVTQQSTSNSQITRLTNKLQQLQQRYHNNQRQYMKKINQQQINNVSLLQKHSLLQLKLKSTTSQNQELIHHLRTQLSSTSRQLSQLTQQHSLLSSQMTERLEQLQEEKENIASNYQSEMLLWKNKADFLEKQKQSQKQHYEDKIQRLEGAVEFMSKNQENHTYSKIVNEVTKKYQFMDLGNNDEMNRRWEEQIKELKRDKERLMQEHQKSLSSEREVRNLKIKEMEEKLKESEYRRQMIINQHQKVKSEWKKEKMGLMKMRKFIEGSYDN